MAKMTAKQTGGDVPLPESFKHCMVWYGTGMQWHYIYTRPTYHYTMHT